MEVNSNALLQKLENKEKARLKKNLLFSILPISVIIAFLVYTSNVIWNGKKEIEKLNQTRANLKLFIDSIRRDSTTRYATSLHFSVLSCDTNWNKTQLIKLNNVSINNSKLALQGINHLKVQNVPFDRVTIRYYIKVIERDKVLKALALSGFSWILVKEDSDDSKNYSNAIHYSRGVDENAIKIAALAIVKAGLEVNAIAPYSGRFSSKSNSIEVGTSSESDHSISVDSIMRFKKPPF